MRGFWDFGPEAMLDLTPRERTETDKELEASIPTSGPIGKSGNADGLIVRAADRARGKCPSRPIAGIQESAPIQAGLTWQRKAACLAQAVPTLPKYRAAKR